MKRKYYLRGLGFGILITTLVFIMTNRSKMTDDEIIQRAEQLGYVKAEAEATPLINLDELREKDGTPTPVVTVGISVTPEPTEEPVLTVTPVPTETAEITLSPTPINVPQEEPEVVSAQIEVEFGNTAIVVCEKIEDAGIVSDGNDLKNYIVNKGLASYINIGTHTLSSDMTYEEIVKILTGR